MAGQAQDKSANRPDRTQSGSAEKARGGRADGGGDSGGEAAPFSPRRHHDSGGGSQRFRSKGGDNSIQDYGSEASRHQFAAAAATLHDYLDARAAAAWAAACGYMSSPLVESMGALEGGTGKPDCPKLMAGLAAGVPKSALREDAGADVAAVRVEGDHAFAIFTRSDGHPYFIPMVDEKGKWKVNAPAPSPLLS